MVKVGGATGAFASEQGLVLSNQHVAFGVIQCNSNAGRNLIDDGFVAASPAEELPANPDFRLRVTVGFEPVTDQVLANARGKAGRTNRYRLADEVQSSIDWTYPTQIKVYEDTLNIIDTARKAARRVAVKYSSMVAGLDNYLKNFGGQLEGLHRADAVEVKRAQEAALEGWLKQQGGAESAALAIKAKAYDGYASPKLGTLPVNFLADLDITGGNSGSPARDANGQLVGLALDGNWESVNGDWLFNPQFNRSIQVDVRCMPWVMHQLDRGDNLLKEMGVSAK